MTRLVLVRHGETEWNRSRRLQGQSDSPLTERGRAQAAGLAERLADEHWHAVYTSDLKRAHDTATIIAGGQHLTCDPVLRERGFGAWEGLDDQTIRQQDPQGHATWRVAEPDFSPPGGESWRAVWQRASDALARYATIDTKGHTILAVTHGGLLRAALMQCLGLPISAPRRFGITNCAYNELEHDGVQWRVSVLGDLSHQHTAGYIRL
ncbi:MAG: histidine phosphatase family protein [Planctomycetota bacterium]|nr:histidine phosphatase family protein [Planctomycetota bacterium]